MRIVVSSTLDRLERDLLAIPGRAHRAFAKTTRTTARRGTKLAKANAKESAGAHGKHYADRIDAEMLSPLAWEYGPSGRPQGEMEFEEGSRNQPAHWDLARSADVIGPDFAHQVGDDLDGVFW